MAGERDELRKEFDRLRAKAKKDPEARRKLEKLLDRRSVEKEIRLFYSPITDELIQAVEWMFFNLVIFGRGETALRFDLASEVPIAQQARSHLGTYLKNWDPRTDQNALLFYRAFKLRLRSAYNIVVDKYYDLSITIARRLLGLRGRSSPRVYHVLKDDIKDFVDDMFTPGRTPFERVYAPGAAEGLIRTTLRGRILSRIKKLQSHSESGSRLGFHDDPTDGVDANKLREVVESCMKEFPEKQQEMFFLRYIVGVRLRLLALKYDTTIATARRKTMRVLSRMKKRLTAAGFDYGAVRAILFKVENWESWFCKRRDLSRDSASDSSSQSLS